MIKVVIFDLGGVIANLKTKESFMKFAEMGLPLPKEMLTNDGPLNGIPSEIPLLDYIHKMDKGEMTGKEFLHAVQQQCNPGTSYEQLLHAYNDLIEVPVNRLAFLKELRKRQLPSSTQDNHTQTCDENNHGSQSLQVFLLSNIGDLHWEAFKEICAGLGMPAEECFDRMYCSYQLGMAKPDPRIFRHLIEDSGINPAEALYIDDFTANIEAGKAAGLQTLHIDANTLDEHIDAILQRLE
ncbi:HAD family phosphatase [Prevotella sp. PINT]|jgi:haloacid dehalogenase superfamily, subfamily IA, variant 3 with third motif having DD or ED|uniref:HAD family hydrolase n=1 Tax=Palleniella intestinalis TaxID=2736291 RepID=UPI0015553004|nr:HAD family phosphatase [Palleniella intestinalis]NPD80892.1 HAD family phosphatase [Palleniella intestinalis]